jgi:hypothetical protein
VLLFCSRRRSDHSGDDIKEVCNSAAHLRLDASYARLLGSKARIAS